MKNKVTKITNLSSLFLIVSFFIAQLFLLPTSVIQIQTVQFDLVLYVLGILCATVLYVGLLYLLQLLFVLKWTISIPVQIEANYKEIVYFAQSKLQINKQETYKLNCVVRC